MESEGIVLPSYPEVVENAYVHTPFCSGACDFCSYFFKVDKSKKHKKIDTYFDSVKKEIEQHRAKTSFALSYIYFGGGTPSLIPNNTLEEFLNFMRKSDLFAPEISGTFELHPEFFRQREAADRFLDILKEYGITRVSLGYQSSDEDILEDTNRRHGASFLNEVIAFLRENNMTINLDLMYGLPGLSQKKWEQTMKDAAACKPDSISTYFLFVDPGTRMWRDVDQGKVKLPGHKELQTQHIMTQLFLEERGFHELPNDFYGTTGNEDSSEFTQDKLPSDSISLPIGAGSYGYYDSTQFYNQFDLNRYQQRVADNRSPIWRGHRLSEAESVRRDIMFSLKNSPHIRKSLFEERYGLDPSVQHSYAFEILEKHELVDIDASVIELTRKGRLCAEEICCLFGTAGLPDSATSGRTRSEKNRIIRYNFAPTYLSGQLPLLDK